MINENDLHEKQVVLLTGDDPKLEQEIEQQLRELTLLPLNIRPLPMRTFQQEGSPRGVALIVTPYATLLPLFSPPLIHADQALTPHQQQQAEAATFGRSTIAGSATSAITQKTPLPKC